MYLYFLDGIRWPGSVVNLTLTLTEFLSEGLHCKKSNPFGNGGEGGKGGGRLKHLFVNC